VTCLAQTVQAMGFALICWPAPWRAARLDRRLRGAKRLKVVNLVSDHVAGGRVSGEGGMSPPSSPPSTGGADVVSPAAGVGAAVYLTSKPPKCRREQAGAHRFRSPARFEIMAGVPSIIFGLFGSRCSSRAQAQVLAAFSRPERRSDLPVSSAPPRRMLAVPRAYREGSLA
jgi:hypothetical protein